MGLRKNGLALGLAMLLGVSAVFAGCGSNADETAAPAAEAPAVTEEANEAGTAADETAAETEDGTAAETDAEEEGPVGETEEFTYLLSPGVDTTFFDDYNDFPTVKYFLSKAWDVDGTKKTLNVDFIIPPAGAEQDNLNTLLATGEYPDVMALAACSESVSSLYEQGILVDLTEYVEKYMPNYMAYLEEHPEMDSQVRTDGKILSLYFLSDTPDPAWGGFMYRRDWIVKYGKNPKTGEAFTGGWKDDAQTEWEDDVVFPSGNEDPIYISDWEWMFEIFQKALDDQGVTDGYAFQNYYLGYEGTGDLNSSFGGGMMGTYLKDGKAYSGYTNSHARAFLTCMRNWYEKGWMNQNFEENSADATWFMVDTASVYSGKVGLWYGLVSQQGAGMDADDALTDGICVYAASQPINDIYGTEEDQNVEPDAYYESSLAVKGIGITDKAAAKEDFPYLLTALNYMYEKGNCIRNGFSREQQAELQDPFYNEHGLEDGAWWIETNEDGEEIMCLNPARDYETGLSDASAMIRVVGRGGGSKGVDYGRSELEQHCMDQLMRYQASAYLIASPIADQLTAAQSEEWALISSNLSTYMAQAVPDFITGRTDIESDTDWQAYCDGLEELGADKYAEFINEIIAAGEE